MSVHSVKNHTVVVTRPEEKSLETAAVFEQAGFETFCLPLIGIEKCQKDDQIDDACKKLRAGNYNWLIFSSANGVKCFSELFKEDGPVVLSDTVKTAVVGKKTAEALEEVFGRKPDLVPQLETAQGLADSFGEGFIENQKVLLAVAEKTRKALLAGLRKKGGIVEEITVYRTNHLSPSPSLLAALHGRVKELIFTFFSPSAFLSGLKAFDGEGELLLKAKIASVGGVTSECIRDNGFSVFYEAERPSSKDFAAGLAARIK